MDGGLRFEEMEMGVCTCVEMLQPMLCVHVCMYMHVRYEGYWVGRGLVMGAFYIKDWMEGAIANRIMIDVGMSQSEE